MFATAHRVVRESTGETGINAFLHIHGVHWQAPQELWRVPETEPGFLSRQKVRVAPGGNRVRSYLDVIAPDDVAEEELDTALTGLWLELVADDAGSAETTHAFPNPVVYRRGRVVLRFGVESTLAANRALEMQELRQAVDPSTATWDSPAP